MASIALVGGDGAGKSTIAQMLRDSGTLPCKYLYMGINPESSNIMLPTSRLLLRLRRHRRSAARSHTDAAQRSATDRSRRSHVRAVLRVANRLAEEAFRQLVSWFHQVRGHVVLYDRHFLFDFYGVPDATRPAPLADRAHLWLLSRFYPRPDLVIFLDAPAHVLISRKQDDKTAEFLESRRTAILHLGQSWPGFVRVDASRPLPAVYREVMAHVECFWRGSRAVGSRASAGCDRKETGLKTGGS
jgi:thymidylate kinase